MRGDEYQNILKLVLNIPGFEKQPEQGEIREARHASIGHRSVLQ
jgi:hypothetical protein